MNQAEVIHVKQSKPRQNDGTDYAVIELAVVRERIDELVQLQRNATEAGKELADAIKATADEAGLLPATLRRFVSARAGDDFDAVASKVQQLALVFEEVGAV